MAEQTPLYSGPGDSCGDSTLRTPRLAFFTVCGGGEDYEFLLGALEHHAGLGLHLVLDTTPPDQALRFSRLPDTVLWIHEPFYGAGWVQFKLQSALNRALALVRRLDVEVVIQVDSDEFFEAEVVRKMSLAACGAAVDAGTVHWKTDGKAYTFGPSEWHIRAWPRMASVSYTTNLAWINHPAYNGNPEHHPVPQVPESLPRVRLENCSLQHLHYGLGRKAQDDETARNTISGWPDQGCEVMGAEWPRPLKEWKELGVRPSSRYL